MGRVACVPPCLISSAFSRSASLLSRSFPDLMPATVTSDLLAAQVGPIDRLFQHLQSYPVVAPVGRFTKLDGRLREDAIVHSPGLPPESRSLSGFHKYGSVALCDNVSIKRIRRKRLDR